jgi:hypothetical protein
MGTLDGRGYEVTAITFTVTAHERPGRFTVPQKIAAELGSGDAGTALTSVETPSL